jgi:hypothetical protein
MPLPHQHRQNRVTPIDKNEPNQGPIKTLRRPIPINEPLHDKDIHHPSTQSHESQYAANLCGRQAKAAVFGGGRVEQGEESTLANLEKGEEGVRYESVLNALAA